MEFECVCGFLFICYIYIMYVIARTQLHLHGHTNSVWRNWAFVERAKAYVAPEEHFGALGVSRCVTARLKLESVEHRQGRESVAGQSVLSKGSLSSTISRLKLPLCHTWPRQVSTLWRISICLFLSVCLISLIGSVASKNRQESSATCSGYQCHGRGDDSKAFSLFLHILL